VAQVIALGGLAGQLRLVGAVLVLVGGRHLVLPRALGWPAELAALRPLTRQVMRAHTFFIGVTCVMLGLVPLTLAADLLGPGRLGAAILGAECGFWGLRWAAQFTAFGPALWRGSRRYTAGWAALSALWTWVGAVFAAALIHRVTG
jgi:hypothetical protein